MRILAEGILSDIFNLLTDTPEIPANQSHILDDLLDPYTAEDLYEAVLERIRQRPDRADVRAAMELFFPRNSKDIPKDVDTELWKKYRDKMENVIVDFVVRGGKDITSRVQDVYRARMGRKFNPYNIPGKVYFGSVLKYMYNKEYSFWKDGIQKLYKQYRKDADKKARETGKGLNTPNNKVNKTQASRNKSSSKLTQAQKARIEKDAIQILKDQFGINVSPADKQSIRNSPYTTAEDIAIEIIRAHYPNAQVRLTGR